VLNPSRKLQFGKIRTNTGSTVHKHFHTFVTTLAPAIIVTDVDSNR